MDKRTKKNRKYTYNPSIIEALVEMYKVTPSYVRQCLSGFSNSLTADAIKEDYKELDKKLQATILIFKNKASEK